MFIIAFTVCTQNLESNNKKCLGKRLAQQSEDLAPLSDWDMWLLLRTHVLLLSPGKLTSLYHEATLTTLKPLSHEYLTGYRDNRVT